jgi:hypothetical protein
MQESSPTLQHGLLHNHNLCAQKPEIYRTYYRKEHLEQHLTVYHHSTEQKTNDLVSSWSRINHIDSSHLAFFCPFCEMGFTHPSIHSEQSIQWESRLKHVEDHFSKLHGMTPGMAREHLRCAARVSKIKLMV